jgi:hypothetical protein
MRNLERPRREAVFLFANVGKRRVYMRERSCSPSVEERIFTGPEMRRLVIALAALAATATAAAAQVFQTQGQPAPPPEPTTQVYSTTAGPPVYRPYSSEPPEWLAPTISGRALPAHPKIRSGRRTNN